MREHPIPKTQYGDYTQFRPKSCCGGNTLVRKATYPIKSARPARNHIGTGVRRLSRPEYKKAPDDAGAFELLCSRDQDLKINTWPRPGATPVEAVDQFAAHAVLAEFLCLSKNGDGTPVAKSLIVTFALSNSE